MNNEIVSDNHGDFEVRKPYMHFVPGDRVTIINNLQIYDCWEGYAVRNKIHDNWIYGGTPKSGIIYKVLSSELCAGPQEEINIIEDTETKQCYIMAALGLRKSDIVLEKELFEI